jgi:hypothetical protein
MYIDILFCASPITTGSAVVCDLDEPRVQSIPQKCIAVPTENDHHYLEMK